ncbi:MAG: hypothetical protein N2050_11135 [Flavobacteriales bacterium]|nr:hypothetical protein [Flavobacteriales bacterium]
MQSISPKTSIMALLSVSAGSCWLTFVSLFLMGCNEGGLTSSVSGSQLTPQREDLLEPQTFSEIPFDIRGCGCFFARDSSGLANKQFIFVSDMDKIAVIRLNNAFSLMYKTGSSNLNEFDVEEKYQNSEYSMALKIREEGSLGSNRFRKSGSIQILDAKGLSRVIPFVGYCGLY